MENFMQELLNTEPVLWLLQFDGAAYLLTVFLVLYAAKLFYDLFTPFSVNEQLTEKDNKAVAVSFSGYMFGMLIILLGIFHEGTGGDATVHQGLDVVRDLLDTLIWGVIGVILLNLARIINDRLILSRFSVIKELVEDRNVGTGAVLWGGYIGSALIIRAAISGESGGWLWDVGGSLLFFLIGQIGFIVYAKIYEWQTRFELHKEIEADNVAAGVAFGLSLVAVGILLSGYLYLYDSLPGFLAWLVISWFVLAVSRYIVDKLILPGALLDEEIARDRNWGAALVEGSIAVGMALLIVPAFLA